MTIMSFGVFGVFISVAIVSAGRFGDSQASSAYRSHFRSEHMATKNFRPHRINCTCYQAATGSSRKLDLEN